MASKIIYRELSYKIVGILYFVIKELGSDYHEKYYQRAIESKLKSENIPYERELKVDIIFESSKIGHHFADFVIDKKIILELKRGNEFRPADIKQVLMYLKSTNLKLGILAYFGNTGVKIKRVINSKYKS